MILSNQFEGDSMQIADVPQLSLVMRQFKGVQNEPRSR